jgi:hypothetical protein
MRARGGKPAETHTAQMSLGFPYSEGSLWYRPEKGDIVVRKKTTDNTSSMKAALFFCAILKAIKQMNLQWNFPTF